MFGWLGGEDIFNCIGVHGKGEGRLWERHIKSLKEHVDHVGGKGVEEDGAIFGDSDGLFPKYTAKKKVAICIPLSLTPTVYQ